MINARTSELGGSGSLSRFTSTIRQAMSWPSLVIGLVLGALSIAFDISLAALIFSGDQASLLAPGIGLILFGAMVVATIVALFGPLPGTIAEIQDGPAPVVALVVASIAAGLPASLSSDERLLAIVAAISLGTFITGCFFLILGHFRLGSLARFLPYPVIGGFLAGTGWLLVTGAITVMADTTFAWTTLPALAEKGLWLKWAPGALFAILMVPLMDRYRHFVTLPLLVAAAIALFYAVAALGGMSVADAGAQGWLLGPFPEGELWRPDFIGRFATVDVSRIFSQAGNYTSIALVCLIGLLLNASGLELSVRRDIDFDKELKATGLANIGASLVGGVPGFVSLTMSALAQRARAMTRLTGLVVGLICGLTMLFGSSLIALFPKVVVGGLLMFMGLSFLQQWVYHAWFKMPKGEYLVMMLILIVIAAFGFLPGIALGTVAAIVLFAIDYSRIDVVKHALDGASCRSRVTRDPNATEYLNARAAQTYVLLLQGYLFFGTADSLLNRVRQRLSADDGTNVRFILLDFNHVTGMDSSATLSFSKMLQLSQARSVTLITSDMDPELRSIFEPGLADVGEGKKIAYFSDLDRAIEWCEERLLAEAGLTAAEESILQEQLVELLGGPEYVAALMSYLRHDQLPAGRRFIHEGDMADELYFIASGQVTAQLEAPGQPPVRLETMRAGRVVGEIGFYLGTRRSAAVLTDEPSAIYTLSQDALRRMEAEAPELASQLHRSIAVLLSQRVSHLITTVRALQR